CNLSNASSHFLKLRFFLFRVSFGWLSKTPFFQNPISLIGRWRGTLNFAGAIFIVTIHLSKKQFFLTLPEQS
ncbi:MAG: hypothetical protein ABIQ95_03885, partial [Bdellovibrionia bacterium]